MRVLFLVLFFSSVLLPFAPVSHVKTSQPIELRECETITKDNAFQLKEVLMLDDGEKPSDLAWSPDSHQLAVAWFGMVELFDFERPDEPGFFKGSDIRGWSTAAFSSDGAILAASNGMNTVQLIDVEIREVITTLSTGDANPLALAFSPDGSTLAVSDFDGGISLWDMEMRRIKAILQAEKMDPGDSGRPIRDLEFSPDGTLLASAPLSLWDVETGTERYLPLNLTRDIYMAWGATDIAFTPDGQLLAAVHANSKTQGVWFWDIPNQEKIPSRIYDRWLSSIAFNPDGTLLAVGNENGTFYIEENFTEGMYAQPLNNRQITSHNGKVDYLTFSPDGKLLASASNAENTVKVWGICE